MADKLTQIQRPEAQGLDHGYGLPILLFNVPAYAMQSNTIVECGVDMNQAENIGRVHVAKGKRILGRLLLGIEIAEIPHIESFKNC